MLLPAVGLEEEVVHIRAGEESGTNAEFVEGRVHDATAHDIKE